MKEEQSKNSLVKAKQASDVANVLYERIASVIRGARESIVRSVDSTMVKAYWNIGHYIVEEEQGGSKRATYGKELLKDVSAKLSKEFGRGFGVTTLEDIRKFYLAYAIIESNEKSHALRGELQAPKFHPNLSWTHYRALMRVHRIEARTFYEVEAIKNCWSSRELERQINSLLFDRLAKSKDKAGLMCAFGKHV
jgi:hypothetical protein